MIPNQVTKVILASAFKIHTALGPGLLEETYKIFLKQELQKQKIQVSSEVALPVIYEGTKLDIGYRIDLLVENSVIVELKSVEQLMSLHRAQLLTYLKLSKITLGLLLNFNCTSLKDGIVRLINT